jgi:hypothetical protein
LAAKKTWVWIFNPHQASNLDLDHGLKKSESTTPHYRLIFNLMLIQITGLVSADFTATATLSKTLSRSSRMQAAAGDNSSGRMLTTVITIGWQFEGIASRVKFFPCFHEITF